ncbi:unnamed protein product, partial [marine sediment metagenome]
IEYKTKFNHIKHKSNKKRRRLRPNTITPPAQYSNTTGLIQFRWMVRSRRLPYRPAGSGCEFAGTSAYGTSVVAAARPNGPPVAAFTHNAQLHTEHP